MILPVAPDAMDDAPPPTLPPAPAQPSAEPRRSFKARLGRLFWQGKIGPAFWTVASLVSLAVNIFLIVLLIVLARQLFNLKSLVSQQLIGGLYQNFVLMDQARISTTVRVQDTIPVVFDLPVQTETRVSLTKDTRIRNATVNLSTGGLTITNAPANIVLPAGTELPIFLSMVVPVSTTVPVNLTVPVDIPLNQTELHRPFVGLQEVIRPYQQLLAAPPHTWEETPFCKGDWTWVVCDYILLNEKMTFNFSGK